jgi:hypothetical protein
MSKFLLSFFIILFIFIYPYLQIQNNKLIFAKITKLNSFAFSVSFLEARFYNEKDLTFYSNTQNINYKDFIYEK